MENNLGFMGNNFMLYKWFIERKISTENEDYIRYKENEEKIQWLSYELSTMEYIKFLIIEEIEELEEDEDYSHYEETEERIQQLIDELSAIGDEDIKSSIIEEIEYLKESNEDLFIEICGCWSDCGINNFEDLVYASMYEFLKEPNTMLEFCKYANIDTTETEIRTVSEAFEDMYLVNYETLEAMNGPNLIEYIKELLQKYDMCVEIYRNNPKSGLEKLLFYDEEIYNNIDSNYNILYSFLNNGMHTYDEQELPFELGKECLLYLTGIRKPYPGLNDIDLIYAIYFNHSLFEIDLNTNKVQMKNPNTFAKEFYKYVAENCEEEESLLKRWTGFIAKYGIKNDKKRPKIKTIGTNPSTI